MILQFISSLQAGSLICECLGDNLKSIFQVLAQGIIVVGLKLP